MNRENETGSGECLTEDLFSGYLDGVLTPVVKSACEVHLIACDRCRENLAVYMRLLREEVDPEEEAELDRALAQWDQRGLKPVPAGGRTSFPWRWISYGLGAVAAVFVMALLFRGFLFWGQPTAEDLLQSLLQDKRPFDAQLSRQPYVALNNTRSPEPSVSLEPLANEMTKRSADAYRFGRFYLISREYDKAIEKLTTAAEDTNAPPEVHNDLAVGYLERFGDGDFERSRGELSRALLLDPAFLPAIFNLSLLYDRNGMTDEADRTRERYLALDSSSGWAQEVRQKLSRKSFEK